MRVLIAEQHHKPGGYCTSFKRQGLTFDAAAHSFGGYRDGGIVKKVFSDLGLENRLHITKNDPSDIIITPGYQLSFWSDIGRTIEDLKKSFPDEQKNIESFFELMGSVSPQLFVKMRKMTFLSILDSYFRNEEIKAIIAIPLFTNGGLPPSLLSFCVGATIFSEFLLDGGYYPAGGMQALSDAFADKFREYGGDLRLSCRIKKITTDAGSVTGIITDGDFFFRARQVISNGDARATFFSLLDGKIVRGDFRKKINNMTPSTSYFVGYFGLDGILQPALSPGTTLSYLPHYDLDKAYKDGQQGKITKETGYIMRISPDATTLNVIVAAPFKDEAFWVQNKTAYADFLVDHVERTLFPGLRKRITCFDSATPQSLWRYTKNYKGAAYGWASIPSQFSDIELKTPSCIKNLFLVGHWTTQGFGIAGVVYSGLAIASLIQRKHRNKCYN
jgi:phytoene dehydrogenase-like protein